jgi:hypothetical protein
MQYHLKKNPPRVRPDVFRHRPTLYLTAEKSPSVILKKNDEKRPAASSVRAD